MEGSSGPSGSTRILVCTPAPAGLSTPACHLLPGGRMGSGSRSPERGGGQQVRGTETHAELEVRLGIHPDPDSRGTRGFPVVFVVCF